MVVADVRPSNVSYRNVKSFAHIKNIVDVPNLIQVQLRSFDYFKTDGLHELFEEISPIEDFSGGRFALAFLDHEIREPKYSERECRRREITYSAPLYVTVELEVKSGDAAGEKKQQTLFMGDIPMMTRNGTFVINGAERVVVSQLVRSPGAYFERDLDPGSGRALTKAKLIPYRGAWVELETSNKDLLSVKVDRKRKTPITTLLRALGYATDEEIKALFKDVDTNPDRQYIDATLARDTAVTNQEEALVEFYRRLRPGEPPSVENAKALLESLFFNPRKYDLGRVGRYKLNRKLGDEATTEDRTLVKEDMVALIRRMIRINNGEVSPDDIDHLGNRRVRAVGELIQNQLRVGLLRMERVVKERMTTEMDPATTTPAALVNIRPVVASVREFFGGSQLSQFMDQTNPLAELTHKRRLSALGPGGLSRERAGFDVRDVHHSHYGRICPIETPEGPNIGLLGSLATYARTNDFGFLETPYRRVLHEMATNNEDLIGRTVLDPLNDEKGEELVRAGGRVPRRLTEQLAEMPVQTVGVKAFVSSDPNDVIYLSADEEETYIIGQANTELDNKMQIIADQAEIRVGESFAIENSANVQFMDVSPMQIVSISTALIPFLEHDDANRALMGSNMQRQAVPLMRPQAPIVGTGMETRVARDSGQVVLAEEAGLVIESTGYQIKVLGDESGKVIEYPLTKFVRSNQGTCINQRPIVDKGDIVTLGQPLGDSSSTDRGDLALGQNILVAFMSWEGYNYEDAIILSEDMVKDDRFTSIHIAKHEAEARETKLGPEEITRDIPNVGEDSLRDLDEEGVIRIGAYVGPGDILVGKITPKGETELTAEEKLLRAIFGEKARDVRDTSLRVPHGSRGKVIDVKVLTKDAGDDLPAGVTKLVRVWMAQTRKITEGDKMAGRHGNKGVIAKILPREDMPHLPDGTPMDIILNPIGVPSRMNLGQVLETHLGWAADTLGFDAQTPVFDGTTDIELEDVLARAWMVNESGARDRRKLDNSDIDDDVVRAWLDERGYKYDELFDDSKDGPASAACLRLWLTENTDLKMNGQNREELFEEARKIDRKQHKSVPIFGKMMLIDGRTGEAFDQPITVGKMYILKLIHLVEEKIHARSTGPYSLITQQPLGGKAQFGGQRFGEMEVWALEAYSAAYNLQEMLTVKSDDVDGRVKTYEANVKGEDVVHPGVPESFHVLLKELQGLGLSVELLNLGPEEFTIPGDAGTTGTLTAGFGAGLWGSGSVDEKALAAAASMLAETSDVQDEAVLAADGWTEASSNNDSENTEGQGLSEESPEDSREDSPEDSSQDSSNDATDQEEPSATDLDDEDEDDEAEEDSDTAGSEEDEE
ncbi:MAG: DNA-directed RNA polymerase subunit beta [Chloroflexi bacterium]|nr:DNA-directed RNA polymerase subunit beta [Chloroflexota bacterium]